MDKTFTEQIKNELLDDIEHYEAEAQLWKQVKRQHKKDGSDFKRLEQNFTKCEIRHFYQSRYITVRGLCGNRKFCSDDILVAINDKYQFSTADELQAAIQERIADLEKRVAELRRVAGIVEEALDDFQQEIDATVAKLKEKVNNNETFGHIIHEYQSYFKWKVY